MSPFNIVVEKYEKFRWNNEQEEALQKIKKMMNEKNVLQIPDSRNEFILYTDASNVSWEQS